MNKGSVKLQGIGFAQLTLAERLRLRIYIVQHLSYLFVNHHQAEYKLMWENVAVLHTLNVSAWMAVLRETLY